MSNRRRPAVAKEAPKAVSLASPLHFGVAAPLTERDAGIADGEYGWPNPDLDELQRHADRQRAQGKQVILDPNLVIFPRGHPLAFDDDLCDLAISESVPAGDASGGRQARNLLDNPATGPVLKRVDKLFRTAVRWWGFDIFVTTGSIYRYGIGSSLVLHQDHMCGTTTLKLAMTVQLSESDAYSGGDLRMELTPVLQPWIAPRERGSVIVFPFWELHSIERVTAGERFSLVGSATGPPLR